jgi:7-cyano-7-deazaguanine reductase
MGNRGCSGVENHRNAESGGFSFFTFPEAFIMSQWGKEEKERPVAEEFRDILETFANSYPQRNYVIEIICPEFTSVCPKTGQPDYATLKITYVPDRKCVELKSLKFYLQRFRNEGIFYENVTNRILDDLVAAVQPRQMTLVASFTPRGGISTNVTAKFESRDSGASYG